MVPAALPQMGCSHLRPALSCILALCGHSAWSSNVGMNLGRLQKGMATHFSILAWRIPWTEEPGGLQFTGLQRVGHD